MRDFKKTKFYFVKHQLWILAMLSTDDTEISKWNYYRKKEIGEIEIFFIKT